MNKGKCFEIYDMCDHWIDQHFDYLYNDVNLRAHFAGLEHGMVLAVKAMMQDKSNKKSVETLLTICSKEQEKI